MEKQGVEAALSMECGEQAMGGASGGEGQRVSDWEGAGRALA